MEPVTKRFFRTFTYLAVGVLIIQTVIIPRSNTPLIHDEKITEKDTTLHFPDELVPDPQSDVPVSITFTDLPHVGTRDNHAELNLVGETLITKEFMDSKPTSIPATYFATMTLYNMEDPAFTAMIPDLVGYLMGHYNSSSNRFTDAINYSYYEGRDGTNLLHAPYSPEISHYMAIILLARCGELQNLFSAEELLAFDVAIWNTQNADGGFGDLHDPNSTLLETYFSVYALAAMSDFVFGFLFPAEILAIQQFLRDRQINDIFTGPFSELDEDIFGWTMFLASWLALNTVELMDGDPSEYKDDFISFWQDYDLYNSETHCFYGSFNERIQPDIVYYYGTAIVGDCVRILGVESEFPDLPQADIVLLNSTRYNQNGIPSGPNFFEITSSMPIDDLLIQFLVTHYLANRGKMDLLKDANNNYQGLSEFFQSYFVDGGASALSQWETTATFDYEYYSSLGILSDSLVNTETLFDTIMMKRADSQDHFQAYTQLEYRYLEPAIELFYNPVASSYHLISLLDQFDLLMDFYVEVGMDYLNYEGWFVSQLSPVGYFYDNDRWFSGNLESTYMALAGQNILITFNQGQVIENYYPSDNISLILEYLAGFISETPEYWYASADSEQLDRFQATMYVLEIFDILHHNFSDSRVEDWITMEKNHSEALSLLEFGHLCELTEYLGMDFPKNPSFSHNDVKTLCDTVITSDILLFPELSWLITMTRLNTIQVLMDIPQSQVGNEPSAYSIQVISFLSVESVEEIRIQGEHTQFTEWTLIGGQYEGTIVPEINGDPTLWAARILFTWNGLTFESPFMVSLEVPWNISWGYRINDLGTSVWCVLTIDEEIGTGLVPSVQILGSNDEIIESFSAQEIQISQQGNEFNYSITLTEYAYTNESFYDVAWDFNVSWLNVPPNHFQFIKWEPSSTIPPNEPTPDPTDPTTPDPPSDSTDPTSSSNDTTPSSSKPKLDLGLSSVLFGSTSISGVVLVWLRKKFQHFA
jgi:hypothetical protein